MSSTSPSTNTQNQNPAIGGQQAEPTFSNRVEFMPGPPAPAQSTETTTLDNQKLAELRARISESLADAKSGVVALGENNTKFIATMENDGTLKLQDSITKETVTITSEGKISGNDEIINAIVRSLARQGVTARIFENNTNEPEQKNIVQKAFGFLSRIAQGVKEAYIRQNSTGVEVQSAQDLLLDWMEKSGDPELSQKRDALMAERAKGVFGPESVQVLKEFQKSVGLDSNGQLFSTGERGKLGLEVDGILGIRTLNALAQWNLQQNTQTGLLAWGKGLSGDNSALLAAVKAEQDQGLFGEKSRELFNRYRQEKGLGEGEADEDFTLDKATYERLLQDWSSLGLGKKPEDTFSQYIYNLSWGNLDEFKRLTGDSWGGRFDGVQGLGDGADFIHNKMSPEATQRVAEIARSIGARPEDLMAVISFETGGSFSPSIKNPMSGATGLIQFMPATARGLGTSVEALSQMSQVQQLDYVEKYFAQYKGRDNMSLEDLYMAVLWPAAVGKPDSHVLFSGNSKEYRQNSGLDVNRDGAVTKYEAAAKVREHLSYIERDIQRITDNPTGTIQENANFRSEALSLAQDYNNRGYSYGSGVKKVDCVGFVRQFYENLGLDLSDAEVKTIMISHWDNLSDSQKAAKYKEAVRNNSSEIFGAPKVLVDRGLADYVQLDQVKEGDNAVIQYHWLNSKGEQRGHVGVIKDVVRDNNGNITGINLISANSPSKGIGTTFVPLSEVSSYKIARVS